MISQNRCLDIKNHLHFVISQIRFFISHKGFCEITKSARFFNVKTSILWYQKIEFVISLNHGGFLVSHFFYIYITKSIFIQKIRFIFYITKSILWYQNRFGYIKFDFVISQSGGFIVHTGLFQDFINNKLLTVNNLRFKEYIRRNINLWPRQVA